MIYILRVIAAAYSGWYLAETLIKKLTRIKYDKTKQ